jgi:stage III sporulation protein AG
MELELASLQSEKIQKWLRDHLGTSQKMAIPILCLVSIGLLMIWAGNLSKPATDSMRDKQIQSDKTPALSRDEQLWSETTWERELAQTLSRIQGAGQVYVDITTDGTEVNVWHEREENDIRQVQDGVDGSRKERQNRLSRDLVFSRSHGGCETPVLRQKKRPKVMGVVVIAEGAANPVVREEIWQAAIVITGAESHRVVVVPGDISKGGE